MLHGVGGLLSLTVISDVGQGDNSAAGNRIAFLGLGVDALELVAGVALPGQAARLDHNGRIDFVNPCGAGVGVGVLLLTVNNVTHGVVGGLRLLVILDVGQGDNSAAGNRIAFLGLGVDALELVAGVALPGQAARLDHNGRIDFVNPCGAGVGVGVLLLTVNNVTHGVVGGLRLLVILDVGQGDNSAAGNSVAFLHIGGAHAAELVANVGVLCQSSLLHNDGGIRLTDPCGAGVGLAGLFNTIHYVTHGVAGILGLALVLHIVQSDYVALSCNRQRLRLCGIKFITGDFNFMVSCVHRSAQCLIGNQHLTAQLIVRALLQIPHGIAQIRPFRPDRVQVCALFRDVDGIPGEIGGCAVLGCGPADENVAGGGGEAQVCSRLYCCEGVGANTGLGTGVRSVVVGQSDRSRCLGVHGGEGHVAAHLHGLAGLIDLVGCRVLPVEEPQVAILWSQDRGVAAALIGVVVLRALLVAFRVGNREGFQRSGEVGHQNHRGIELGIRVEQRLCAVAVHGEPGAGRAAVLRSDLLHQLLIPGCFHQRGAVGNAQRSAFAAHRHRQKNGCSDLGGRPLGIEGDVLGGHGLAIELEGLALTGLVIIPTSKLVTRRHTVRPGGFIAHAAQRLLVLHGLRLFRSTVVDEDNVVTVAGVVEFGVVIIAAKAGSFLIGKTGDRISIFLCDNISPARRGIAMVQLVGNSALVDRTSLSRENLYIVVCRFASAVLIRPIVAAATYGHNIDVTLICRTVPSSTPRTAAVNRRPLIRDVCTVLCGNGYLADISAGTAVGMLFLRTAKPFAPFAMRMLLLPAGVIRIIQIERNGIHIALVVHIHNGAAVTGDGLLLNGLSLEALIALGRSFRFLAGGAGLGFGLLKGIILIIGIFLPVDHGVLGVLRCGPVGLQVRRCVDLGHRLSVLIPAVEGIARPGRSRRQRHGLAVLGEDGGHIVAALGIEDDPVAGLDHRINIDGTGGEGNRTGLTAQRAAPAHNGFRGAQRQVHHLGSGIQVGIGNGIAAAALGGMYYGAAVLAHEQDIAEFREHCIDPNGLAGNTADRAGHHRDLILAVEPEPALEHGPILAGVTGHIQVLAFLKALCPGILPDAFHIELIGIDQGLIVFHNAALGRIGLAGRATIVDMAIRALGGAGGANQFFLFCSRLGVNRVQLFHAALAAGAHIVAVCTDLAVGIGMLHIAEVLAAAGLGLCLRLLVGCAGCVFLVFRIPGAIVRGCIAISGIACFRIFLGCAGCVFLVFRIPGAIVRGCIAIFGIVCFRIFLGCALRRCSRSLGCAGCVCGVLLCLHRLGGFCAAGGRLCKGTHRAQAEQHTNRQQHCDPSFHVLLPLV